MTGPARTGFAVLCHRNPEQVNVLLDQLAPNPVALHVDADAPPDVARAVMVRDRHPHVTMVRSFRTPWASLGLVEAAFECVRSLVATGVTHVTLLSGQDLPLVPVAEIDRFLESHAQASYLCAVPMPFRLWGSDGGRSRFTHYNIRVGHRRLAIPARRRLPNGWAPFGGPMQWCLHRDLASMVLTAFDRSPAVRRFFRHTWIPDEIVVPTIAMNSPLARSVVRENLWFIRWREGSAHPETLTMADLDDLRRASRGPCDVNSYAERKLFARKFDQAQDPGVIDALTLRTN